MANLILIAAVDKRYGLAKNGDLPWKDDESTKWDLKHFKETTTGYPIVMGYNTYKTFKKPLPNRTNFVVNTHKLQENALINGVSFTENLNIAENKDKFIFVDGFKNACNAAIRYADSNNLSSVFIIGGANIYEKVLRDNIIFKAIITHFSKDYMADLFFPISNIENFKKKIIEEHDNGKIIEYSRF